MLGATIRENIEMEFKSTLDGIRLVLKHCVYIFLHTSSAQVLNSMFVDKHGHHFYSKNFEILRNLCLLTLIIRGLIAIKLQVLGGGGCQGSNLKILVYRGLLDLNDLI